MFWPPEFEQGPSQQQIDALDRLFDHHHWPSLLGRHRETARRWITGEQKMPVIEYFLLLLDAGIMKTASGEKVSVLEILTRLPQLKPNEVDLGYHEIDMRRRGRLIYNKATEKFHFRQHGKSVHLTGGDVAWARRILEGSVD